MKKVKVEKEEASDDGGDRWKEVNNTFSIKEKIEVLPYSKKESFVCWETCGCCCVVWIKYGIYLKEATKERFLIVSPFRIVRPTPDCERVRGYTHSLT